MNNSVIVVGGGIAGILASILLADRYEQVYLLERDKYFGGLLRSSKTKSGVYFDKGTHILSETGIAELDHILFGELDEEEWHYYDVLKVGNFFCGQMYKNNQYIFAPFLPKEIHERGLQELKSTDSTVEANNLKDFSEKFYGKTYTKYIFEPVMRKVTSCDLSELHPDALKIFGYNRLIVGPPEVSNQLKKNKKLETKISYNSYYDAVSPFKKYYPKHGFGTGKWVDHLIKKAQDKGAILLPSVEVQEIKYENKKVQTVQLRNGHLLQTDLLVWTLPVNFLFKLTGLQQEFRKPKTKKLVLFHIVFDKPFMDKNYYCYCNEEGFSTFRITLYSNFIPECNLSKCTVEAFVEDVNNEEILRSQIINEIKMMGIIDERAKVIELEMEPISSGFPIYTTDFVKLNQDAFEQAGELFENVLLLGKGSGKVFFMNEVLSDVYHKIIHDQEEKK